MKVLQAIVYNLLSLLYCRGGVHARGDSPLLWGLLQSLLGRNNVTYPYKLAVWRLFHLLPTTWFRSL